MGVRVKMFKVKTQELVKADEGKCENYRELCEKEVVTDDFEKAMVVFENRVKFCPNGIGLGCWETRLYVDVEQVVDGDIVECYSVLIAKQVGNWRELLFGRE